MCTTSIETSPDAVTLFLKIDRDYWVECTLAGYDPPVLTLCTNNKLIKILHESMAVMIFLVFKLADLRI